MATKKVIVFHLDGNKYAFEIGGLQGIENYESVTAVANVPDFVDGVVNIRDEIIPVLNLKTKFKLPAAEVTEDTKIILVNSESGKVGCLIDGVIGMNTVTGDDVQEFPKMLQGKDTQYADSIVRIDGDLIVVIGVNHLMDEEEAKSISNMLKEEQGEEENE